jgi:uncharacterized membrane protein
VVIYVEDVDEQRRRAMSEQTSGTADAVGDSVVGAVSDGVYTLIIADFADTDSALQAYEDLKAVEDGRTVEVEGAIVVKRDVDGAVTVQQVTDHSTRRGLTWGAVGGVVLGVVFPPSILGSAVVLGAAGAGIGKGRERHHRKDLEEQLKDAIAPGHSGLVALVSDPGAVEIAKALARAERIVRNAVDDVLTKEIKAAAKEAEDEVKNA